MNLRWTLNYKLNLCYFTYASTICICDISSATLCTRHLSFGCIERTRITVCPTVCIRRKFQIHYLQRKHYLQTATFTRQIHSNKQGFFSRMFRSVSIQLFIFHDPEFKLYRCYTFPKTINMQVQLNLSLRPPLFYQRPPVLERPPFKRSKSVFFTVIHLS